MSVHSDPAENAALFAFMKATVHRVDTGHMGVRNALSSVAIVIAAWAKSDPELFHRMCASDEQDQ
jgi:hypothetical protein